MKAISRHEGLDGNSSNNNNSLLSANSSNGSKSVMRQNVSPARKSSPSAHRKVSINKQ